jgi:hypothetical protein
VTEYWKEFLALAGGIAVLIRLIQFGRKFVTREELSTHCEQQMKLVNANTRVAVLEAMNEWLKHNGGKLKN